MYLREVFRRHIPVLDIRSRRWFYGLSEQLKKRIAEKKDDIQVSIMNGAKDVEEYHYLRGRYNSLADLESELRELLKKVIENDEQGNSS